MRLLYIWSAGLVLTACGQADYSTWNCYADGQSDRKVVMVLQDSTMKIEDQRLTYCGGLGLVTYFDRSCKAEIKDSMAQLIPSQSLLSLDKQQYRCEKL